MKRVYFTSIINAPRQTVWDAMIGPETYKDWTTPFAEGSYYDGSWEQGSRIRFLGPDGGGMVSVIDENRPLERIDIRHLGMIQNGVEDTESEEVKKWAPSHEIYELSDAPGGSGTEVHVELDVAPDWEGFMLETWPKALDRLKAISEAA
jgi:uncharacterized protein YndB with AHSA1/START domain